MILSDGFPFIGGLSCGVRLYRGTPDLSFASGGTAGLDPGESVTLFVKVAAPSGAAVGTVRSAVFHARRHLRELLADWKE